jgi:hypothetical protein
VLSAAGCEVVMDGEAVRRVALGFADTVERDHHGFPSFRGGKRIFATLPDPDHLHVMLDEEDIRAAVAEWPGWCEEKWWGKKLAALRVTLPDADPAIVAELLEDAWRQRA